MEAFAAHYLTQFSYLGIFSCLMLTVFGFPFPEDAVLLISGAAASRGVTAVLPTLWVAYLGVLVGDMLLYLIGRRFGGGIVTHKRFGKVLTEERLARATGWFDRWGNPLIFFGRHIVGVRAQIFLCAGVFRLSVGRVVLYDGLSALIGVPLMVWLGYAFGNNLAAISRKVAFLHWGIAGVAAATAMTIYLLSFYKRK